MIINEYFKGLSPRQQEQFEMLQPLYEDWNSKINVVSRKDIDKLMLHHVLHSLAIAKFVDMADLFHPGTKVMDVGTGGGFPGIPLAIMYPQVEFLLVDSIGKKIKVVEAVAQSLGLENVKAVKARAEEIDGKFDFIVSRAVTDLGNFLPWVKGKYEKGIIDLKGGELNPGGELYKEIENAANKCRINKKTITFCSIDEWFKDGFFEQKRVIYIPR